MEHQSDIRMQCWPSLAQYGRTLSLKGGNLFYYDTHAARTNADQTTSGASQPALILIHGLGDEADSFRHIIPLLAGAGFRVIAPDLPGFGRSTGADGKMPHNTDLIWKRKIGLDEHAGAVLALMEETGATGRAGGGGSAGRNPVILIGSSMGATIAQIAAVKQPKQVRALILIDGCHPMSGKTDSGLLLMALSSVGRRWYRNFRKNHEGAWRSLYGYYRDLDAMSEEDKTFLRNRVIDRVESLSQEEAYFLSLHSVIAFNMRGEKKFSRAMKGFTGKILVLWGESDRVMPFEKTSRFQSLHPDADFQFIKGAGHLPHQEAPRETAGAIVKWIGA